MRHEPHHAPHLRCPEPKMLLQRSEIRDGEAEDPMASGTGRGTGRPAQHLQGEVTAHSPCLTRQGRTARARLPSSRSSISKRVVAARVGDRNGAMAPHHGAARARKAAQSRGGSAPGSYASNRRSPTCESNRERAPLFLRARTAAHVLPIARD